MLNMLNDVRNKGIEFQMDVQSFLDKHHDDVTPSQQYELNDIIWEMDRLITALNNVVFDLGGENA